MTKKKSTLYPLTRHTSFLHKHKPAEFNRWLDQHNTRSLSVPDLHKLKKEWDTYQQSDSTPENRITDTKMQARKTFFFVAKCLLITFVHCRLTC
jgi:hypothetical protein